jgi:hypothetical protein
MSKKIFNVFLSAFLTLTLIFGLGTTALAKSPAESASNETNFNLAEYLTYNPVNSESEFISVILNKGSDEAIESLDNNNTILTSTIKEDFSYTIDMENQIIYTTTIAYGKETPISPSKTTANEVARTVWQNTGTATHKGYSWTGIPIYTITTSGTFQYDNSTFCNVIKSNGFFTPAYFSLWDSETSVNSGQYSNTKAYAESYGTASLNMAIADLVGIDIKIQSFSYSLELNCDKYGNFDYDYKEY